MFGSKKEYDKRFEIVNEQSVNMIGITIVRDIQTGVNYLMGQGVNGFAITPLLDKDGKPMITNTEHE